jgi:hypothetical protein
MSKHKLAELQKMLDEKIGTLKEEVEIGTNVRLNPLYIADRRDGTNVRLNPLYIADRRDEIEFLQWTQRIIQSILNRDYDERQQLGAPIKRLEMMDTIEFETTLQERVQELELKLKDCNSLRALDILINEIDTLESILGRLSDLKYGAETRAIEVANANNDFKQANRLRKQLIKIQDIESEITAQCSNTKLRSTS